MDSWIARHFDVPFDRDGKWAASGRVVAKLLERLLAEPYFSADPPKSTGRELFNDEWLAERLTPAAEAADVQATLLELTARSVADALKGFSPSRVIACGGGARNQALMRRLAELLAPMPLESSESYAIDPQLVEALAFAWLAMQALRATPASVPAVTGARGPRVLGAIYPA